MAYDSEIKDVDRDLLVLQKARDLVAKGWLQGKLWDWTGSTCAIGALMKASRDEVERERATKKFYKALPQSVLSIAGWNDSPSRTQEEVVAAFDKAIQLQAASKASVVA